MATQVGDKELLNKVASSEPINITAVLVTSRGVDYKCPKPPSKTFSHTPFATRKVPINSLDLTEKKFGDLIVFGLSIIRKGKSKKRSLWIVKCVCGNYETRTSQGLRGHGEKQNLKCYECQYNEWKKNVFSKSKGGK